MSINIETVAEKTFNVLKGFGFEVRSFDKDGNQVINPKEATRFAVAEPNLLARLDIKEKELLLATSQDLSESPVRDMLKELAQDYLMSFDYKIFDKKIKPKGEKVDIKRNAETDMADVMEEINTIRKLSGLQAIPEKKEEDCVDCKGTGFKDGDSSNSKSCKTCDGEGKDDGYFGGTKEYNKKSVNEASLGKMTGSRKSSYQPLADNVKIIVRHNKDVNEEVRGARSRNIHSILIQRGEEKFKMAENNLQAARAMARHLHNGGETFDEIGEAITEMSKDYGKLREFVRYVRKANLVNETNEEFVTLAVENINDIKTNLKRLSGVKSYANAVETVTNYNNVELLQDDLDLESKFTETHFDDKVANVLDNLKVMASKRHAFESYITNAIAKETFENIKDQLKEDELMEFDTPHAKLGHQVSRLGFNAKDEKLGNYLHSISSKLNAGGQLSQFEYGAIKSSLLSAGQHNVQTAPMTATESYEAFLDQFII